ncbi:MAG: DUF481 domain-containing protein [Nannocystaceae bacterium]|nr:DUF481 domain-containing protein [Nannocystaceae bacterium]
MPATGALILAFALASPLAILDGHQAAEVTLGAVESSLVGPAAEANDVPEGSTSQDAASSGATELETQGKFAAADERTAEDATDLEISAGALLSTGNARTFQATANGRFRLRRGRHQFGSAAAGNYGRAAADVDSPVETTVSNIQGMVRYDYFFAKRWAAFLMTTGRNDRFQGLDLRLNIDPGVAFYALTNPKHRLWFEAGYDFQFDDRRLDAILADVPVDPDDPDGETRRVALVDERATNHAVRLFAGYSNQLSDLVSLDTGLEYLQSVLVAKRLRLNWVNSVTASLGNRIGLATTFTLRYENQPLPGVKKLDTITAFLLTVKFI